MDVVDVMDAAQFDSAGRFGYKRLPANYMREATMSELQQPEPRATPRVPTDVPWGIVAGLAVCVAYLALTVPVGLLVGAVVRGPGLARAMVTSS